MAERTMMADGRTGPLVRRLWREWMRPHAPALALVLVMIAVVGGATGMYPVLIKLAFEAFEAKDAQTIMLGPIAVIAVTAVKGFAVYGMSVLTNRVVTRIEADMQSRLYAHLIDADLAELGRENPATLAQRFTTDFVFIREALTRLSTVFLRELATLSALVLAMLWIDPVLTLVAAVVTPFAAYPVARVGKKLRRVASSTQEQIGAMAGLVSESLGGARVAKTYGLESYLKARATAAFEDVRRLKMKAVNARGRLDPVLETGAGIAVACVLVLIGWRILDGRSTVGDFTGFVTALGLAAHPVRALGNLNAVVQEGVAALMRYYATVDQPRAIADRPDAVPLQVTKGELRFAGVHFHYEADIPALDGIDLVAPGGRTTALVGRSGSGKSTLLSLVPRLYDATGGAVMVDGQDVRAVHLRSLREHIAVVSQDVVLFDGTVRANIAFGRQGASDDEIVEAARAAAAHGFIERLPQGYETRVGVGGARLSGGERQRVSLARAFLKNAPILLLDEATSSLDAESEQLIQEALGTLMQGRTTLVIAHRLSTIRAADLIVVMEAGRVVETGSHDALMARGGSYARLQRLQIVENGPERLAAKA